MPKFGITEIIRPLSTEKIIAERSLFVLGKVKSNVEKVSESIKGDKAIAAAEAIKAIGQCDSGNSDYAAIEIFTDSHGISRINICHMRELAK